MSDVVVVTGASGGIGADLARVFAAKGHALALVARSTDKLDALADELSAPGRPRPLVVALDLAAPDAGDRIVRALADAGVRASILVNNAGYGLLGEVATLDRAAQVGIVDLNIRALTDLTLALLPQIRAARGKILNVASIAGLIPGPGMAVYYASKAYVISFSQALGEELRGDGVRVTALCPGLTTTGFQARAGMGEALTGGLPTMGSMPVARAGYDGLMAGRRMVFPGATNTLFGAVMPFIPRGLLLPSLFKAQVKRR